MRKRRYKKREWLRKRYCEKRLSAVKIAEKCGVNKGTIYYWLRRHGIAIRNRYESNLGQKKRKKRPRNLKRVTREVLIKEYLEDKDSMKAIAKRYGCSESSVRRKLIQYNIEIRPQIWKVKSREGMSDSWYRKQALKAYEEFWGEPPRKGYLIHHIDEDVRNFDVTNLAEIIRKTHTKIHASRKKERESQVPVWEPEISEIPQQVAA